MPLALAERLKQRIQREGSVTFHDWMTAALYDPEQGYYHRTDLERWGRAGDYRTSPERSPLFAATFAGYFARLYEELERPSRWTIVEFGAGNGSFAEGVLETLASRYTDVFAATRYVVSDLSGDARRRVEERLVQFEDYVQFQAGWESISVRTGILFSNELVDAFPVHRVVQSGAELSELYVTLDDGGTFVWTRGPLSTPRLAKFVREHALQLRDGQIIEINLELEEWLAEASHRLANGFVITVDYGLEATDLYDPEQRPQGTLRGYARHSFVEDLLAEPGEYDVTASVNWTQVRKVGEKLGLNVFDFARQDQFLLNAGFLEELEYQLKRVATEGEKAALTTGAREMILPGGMASSFQVLVQRRVREELSDDKRV